MRRALKEYRVGGRAAEKKGRYCWGQLSFSGFSSKLRLGCKLQGALAHRLYWAGERIIVYLCWIGRKEGNERSRQPWLLAKMPPKASTHTVSPPKRTTHRKRFTNGHKCFTSAQAEFMCEIMNKTERQRVDFNNTCHLLKAPRNPCTGELTSRENAPYLVQMDNTEVIKQMTRPVPQTIELVPGETQMRGTSEFQKLISQIDLNESLRARRDRITQDLEACKKILTHKAVCSYAGFTGRDDIVPGKASEARFKPF